MSALLTPLLVMILGYVAALFGRRLQPSRWAWLAPSLVYWLSMGILVTWMAPAGSLATWFRAPSGGWGWAVLGLGIGVAHLSFLFMNLRVLRSGTATVAWLLFAVINAPLEELFWRGLVLHGTPGWSPWVVVLVVSVLFALNHPITFGPVSPALRHPVTVVGALVMGIAWSWVTLQTGSLWWGTLGHIVTNLGAMAAPVFMGLVVPPIGKKQKASA